MDEVDDPELLALTSPTFAEVRIDVGIARAEFAAEAAVRQTAELWRSIAEILDDAERHPEVFIDSRSQLSASERREYAVRSAVADVAVRLALAESTVRACGHSARVLRSDLPRVWEAFREGRVSVANVRTTVELTAELPGEAFGAFEEAVLDAATRLAPARFRSVARGARERVHHEAMAQRHGRAASQRRLTIDDDLDGMSWLSVYLPSATAHRAFEGIDAAARSVQGDDDRTLEQLRADIAGELLSGAPWGPAGLSGRASSGPAAGVAVSITVPVLTLLGRGDEPGVLHGVGPLVADSARLLAAEAPSFTRILTHPVTGATLELDRAQYRVPADLRRALAHRDRACRFAGCGRRALRCDVDHIIEWQDGGTTDAANLMHLCRHHHRLKSVARWRARPPEPGSNAVTWTSPTGHTVDAEPPPF